MTNLIKSFVRDETGAAAAEYALILGVIGAGIFTAANLLGAEIAAVLGRARTALQGIVFTGPI